jgi:hypothetical protein
VGSKKIQVPEIESETWKYYNEVRNTKLEVRNTKLEVFYNPPDASGPLPVAIATQIGFSNF